VVGRIRGAHAISTYKKRLLADLERWQARGWVSAEGAEHIRKDAGGTHGGTSRIPGLLASIGVICLALAVAAFVAANWSAIPRVAKLSGVLVLLAGAHALAGLAAARGRRLVADLLTMFATLVFVSALALVGQMYHLPQDWPAGAMLVTVGSLAAAWLCASRASLVVASLASVSWILAHGEGADPTPLTAAVAISLLAATALHVIRFPSAAGRWTVLVQAVFSYGWLLIGDASDPVLADDALGAVVFYLGGAVLASSLILWGRMGEATTGSLSEEARRAGPRFDPSALAGAAASLGVILLSMLALSAVLLGVPGDLLAPGGLLPFVSPLVWLMLAASLVPGGLLLRRRGSDTAPIAVICVAWSGLVLAAVLLAWPQREILQTVLALALTLAISVAGTAMSSRLWIVTGNLSLAAGLLYVFWRAVGSLLGQSLFFMVAGVVLVAAALLVSRRMSRNRATGADPAGKGGE
jgi:uncharacterized membrane protein